MKQKKALIKLAQVRLAINHVLRSRMTKQAAVDPYDREAAEIEWENSKVPQPYQDYVSDDPNAIYLPHSLRNGPPRLQRDYNRSKLWLEANRKGKMHPSMTNLESNLTNAFDRIGSKATGLAPSLSEPNPYSYKRYQDAKNALKAVPLYPSEDNIRAAWYPRYRTLYDLNKQMEDVWEKRDQGQEYWDEWGKLNKYKNQVEEPLTQLAEQARFADEEAARYKEQPPSVATRDMFNRDYARWMAQTRQQLGLKPNQPLVTRMAVVTNPEGKQVVSPISGRNRTYDYNAQFPPTDPFNDRFTQEEWDYVYPKMKKQWDRQDKIDRGIQRLNKGIDRGLRWLDKSPAKTMLPTAMQTALPFARWGRQVEKDNFPERWNPPGQRDWDWITYK